MNLFNDIKLKFYEKFNKNKYYEIKCNITKDLVSQCKNFLINTGEWHNSSFKIKETSFIINDVNYKFYYNPDYNGVGIYVNNVFFVKANEKTIIDVNLKFQQQYPWFDNVLLLKTFVDFINKRK